MSNCNYTPPTITNYYSLKRNYKSHDEYLKDKQLQQRMTTKLEVPYRSYSSNESVIQNKKDAVKYNYQFKSFDAGDPHKRNYCESRDCKYCYAVGCTKCYNGADPTNTLQCG
jgi:hypothetical protein